MSSVQQQVKDHRAAKAALMEEEAKMHFSYDLEAGLTKEERDADVKL
jgi:hypothetical protein